MDAKICKKTGNKIQLKPFFNQSGGNKIDHTYNLKKIKVFSLIMNRYINNRYFNGRHFYGQPYSFTHCSQRQKS